MGTERRSRQRAPLEDATEAAEFGVRLTALPRDILRTILRHAGRPARCACRALRDGYGPLDGGLYLEHFTTGGECGLGDLAASSSPGGYRHIHTLILGPRSATSCTHPVPHLDALPATFPALRTLHLGAPIPISLSLLRDLSPLAPHLTSLTATVKDPPSLAALATTLTSIRDLTCDLIHGRYIMFAPDTLATLQPLAPTLLRLTCRSRSVVEVVYAAGVLRALGPFTRLTHLALPSTALRSWDQKALDLLATVAPCLQALEFEGLRNDVQGDALVPDDIWAALARRTALTSLTAACNGLPDSTPPLRLAHLCFTFDTTAANPSTVPLLEALAPSQTLTRLEICSCNLPIPPPVNALSVFADTLQSLAWIGDANSLAALLPLSQLTRLESLSLRIAAPDDDDEHLPDEQAASAIAAALPRLTSLQLQREYWRFPPHHHHAALVAAVARQGALRHLALTCWDLQWGSSLLPPLATSLVRLMLFAHPDHVLQVVESVSSLRALLCLRLRGDDLTVVRAGGAALPELQALDRRDGSSSSSAAAGQHVGSDQGGHAAGQGEAGALRVQLPPVLRQLCMEDMFREAYNPWRLEASVIAALLAAAARQDCVVRVDGAAPPVSSVRLPQHDDCHGYRDGASAEWVEAQRLQQEESKQCQAAPSGA